MTLVGKPLEAGESVAFVKRSEALVFEDHVLGIAHAVDIGAASHGAAVVERDDPAQFHMLIPIFPVSIDSLPGMITVDEQEVDGIAPISSCFITPLT